MLLLFVQRASSNTISIRRLLPVLEVLMRLLAVTRNAPGTWRNLACYSMYACKISNKTHITTISRFLQWFPLVIVTPVLFLQPFQCVYILWTRELLSLWVLYLQQLAFLGIESPAGHRCCLRVWFGSLLVWISLWWLSVFPDVVFSTPENLMTSIDGMWTFGWVRDRIV